MTSDPFNSAESHEEDQPEPEQAEEIQPDLLRSRKLTLADLIQREGGSFMKGESPVPFLVQIKTEINTFISRNLPDVPGALQAVLYRWVDEDIARISRNLDSPLKALLGLLESIVDNPTILYELVRQVDMKWGEMNDERPHFQRPGQLPHPDDEYTHESVDQQLRQLMSCLKSQLEQE